MLVYTQGSKLNVGLHTRVFKVKCWFTHKGLQCLMLFYIQGSSEFNVGLRTSLQSLMLVYTKVFKV